MPATEAHPASPAATQRLFFALWPDAEVRTALAALAHVHARRNGRAVVADNLHVTLAFVGGVTAAQRQCLEAAAATVKAPAFLLNFDRLGFWARPRILWAGTSAPPTELMILVETLNAALMPCGYQPDPRPFQAHVTLARKAQRAPVVRAVTPIVWRADAFCLVASVTGEGGAEYHVMRRWALASVPTIDP